MPDDFASRVHAAALEIALQHQMWVTSDPAEREEAFSDCAHKALELVRTVDAVLAKENAPADAKTSKLAEHVAYFEANVSRWQEDGRFVGSWACVYKPNGRGLTTQFRETEEQAMQSHAEASALGIAMLCRRIPVPGEPQTPPATVGWVAAPGAPMASAVSVRDIPLTEEDRKGLRVGDAFERIETVKSDETIQSAAGEELAPATTDIERVQDDLGHESLSLTARAVVSRHLARVRAEGRREGWEACREAAAEIARQHGGNDWDEIRALEPEESKR